MTRKDYYLVAGAVAKCKSLGEDNLFYIADMVAKELISDNPAVKYDLFMLTAGVSQQSLDEAKK